LNKIINHEMLIEKDNHVKNLSKGITSSRKQDIAFKPSIGCIKIQLEIVEEVVHQMEMARDRRTLASHKESLRREFKLKFLGMTSLQRCIMRQESRLLWLSEGDAPMRFFHIQASTQRCRKFIRSLECDGQVLVDEQSKAAIVFSFFDEVLGTPLLVSMPST
jgi:hypothetical protein